MKFYVVTRFSVPGREWLNSRHFKSLLDLENQEDPYQVYKDFLFSSERLDYKFRTFEALTLPSIAANLQSVASSEWMLFYSTEMPQTYIDRLRDVTANIPQISLIENDPSFELFGHFYKQIITERINKYVNEDKSRFCSVRMDDDDWVYSGLFNDIVSAAASRPDPFIYYCPHGAFCQVDAQGNVHIGQSWSQTQHPHAAALACVDKDILSLGSHPHIPERYPHIPIVSNEIVKPAVYLNCDVNFTATRRRWRS